MRSNSKLSLHNNAIHIVCKIIDAVISSVQEAETGADFLTAKKFLIFLQQTLQELEHPWGPTPLQFEMRIHNQWEYQAKTLKAMGIYVIYMIVHDKDKFMYSGNKVI